MYRFKHGFANCCSTMIFVFFVCFGMTGCNSDLSNKPMPDAKVDLTPTNELVIDLPEHKFAPAIYYDALFTFRNKYPNVNVTVNKIGDKNNDSSDQYQTALASGLMAGFGPDVIITDYFSDLYKTMDAGVFLNLNSIIYSDKDFNIDDYNTIVMDVGNYKQGRYVIPIGYSMILMCGDKITQKDMGFDLLMPLDVNTFLETAADCSPQEYPFIVSDNSYPKESTPPFGSWLLSMSGIRLIDLKTGAVLPDEDELMAFCKAYKPYWENHKNLDIDYRDYPYQDSILLDFTPNAFTKTYNWIRILREGGIPTYLTIDTNYGETVAIANRGVAINGNSKNQLNAWNYIKILLSEDIQSIPFADESINFAAYPVNKAGLEKAINHWNVTAAREGFTADAKMLLKDLIGSVTICNLPTPRLTDFFMQCMMPYFKGSDSLENCINDLREKLEIYVGE